jgi:hypothetical protein
MTRASPVFLALLLGFFAAISQAAPIAMPPTFAPSASIEQTLQGYPLGVLTQQAAFAHHGGAHRKIELPNGLEGWVYDVGGLPSSVPYTSPTGKKQSVRETEAVHAARTYTLVFDKRGVVVDVLYNERGRHDGLSALALQHRRGAERVQAHPSPGPAKD